MAILWDTHALMWWMNGDPRLSRKARAAMERKNAEIYVSAVSDVELATKGGSLEHGRLGGLLPGVHRDPFDRIIAAQSLIERMPVVTSDLAIATFGAEIIW